MAMLSDKTGISLGWALGLLLAAVGGIATVFSWRQEDRAVLSGFENSTRDSLAGIDNKITNLSHRLDMFEQKVDGGMEDRWRRADMKLWLFQARLRYPELPDVER